MFSNKITYLLKTGAFYKVIVARFLIILFRKKRDIQLLHLEYNNDYIFNNSLIVINYRFKNVIYYRFKNHKTLEKHRIIFKSSEFYENFELTVYGFFQKRTYQIELKPQLYLDSSAFKTTFSKLNLNLEKKSIPPQLSRSISIADKKPILHINQIATKKKKITLSNNPFNLNEFI